jgi:hypothetical protein
VAPLGSLKIADALIEKQIDPDMSACVYQCAVNEYIGDLAFVDTTVSGSLQESAFPVTYPVCLCEQAC